MSDWYLIDKHTHGEDSSIEVWKNTSNDEVRLILQQGRLRSAFDLTNWTARWLIAPLKEASAKE